MKLRFLYMSIILIFFLAACGDSEEVKKPPQNDSGDNAATEEQDLADEAEEPPADNTANTNHPYSFTHFDLDVDMENDLDLIEVEYEQEPDETEASYEDRNQDINLSGDEAMAELDKIFSTFDFDETSSKEEVLEAVRTAFNVPEDAKRIEVELTFLDGTEVEFVE